MGKLEESQDILSRLGMPAGQQNEAAAYTLLALANLKENDSWSDSQRNLLRIHDILLFIKNAYGKAYAENTRETIRRRVLHQFERARIVDRNPDNPSRPTNSGKTCYALSSDSHAVIASYGKRRFLKLTNSFLGSHASLSQVYRAEREHVAVQVDMPDGAKAYLSPGRHNELQAAFLRDFWPRFIPEAKLLYLGDTAKKDWHVEKALLEKVGLPFAIHDKYPDLVFWLERKRWLVLVEAVTSHGPFSPKRRAELETMLQDPSIHRVYLTAFPSLKEFKQHLHDIAWETEVWLAEIPDHMIHYNGPKFLAPLQREADEED